MQWEVEDYRKKPPPPGTEWQVLTKNGTIFLKYPFLVFPLFEVICSPNFCSSVVDYFKTWLIKLRGF
ncbi:MAG: hypothetical protein CM15mP106_4610 [Candidatus Neomarinimicrobiota bacterium]|nr:MAG: hypothetical protein CM15mP106_4610 [Candidatus Neomarinimicrobiota bacterium]